MLTNSIIIMIRSILYFSCSVSIVLQITLLTKLKWHVEDTLLYRQYILNKCVNNYELIFLDFFNGINYRTYLICIILDLPFFLEVSALIGGAIEGVINLARSPLQLFLASCFTI